MLIITNIFYKVRMQPGNEVFAVVLFFTLRLIAIAKMQTFVHKNAVKCPKHEM